MSQLLCGSTSRLGPDQFVELFYRNTAYSADVADAVIARRRRVSFTYLFIHTRLTYLLYRLLTKVVEY